ncbi:MAG TPA: hypothetical protein VGG73_14230 [Vicinamibacterales bacterium]
MVATSSASEAAVINVAAGGSLQDALTNAQPGDVVQLAAGATFVGNFTLPNKSGPAIITLQTAGTGWPEAGARIGPAQAGQLAKLRSPNNAPALQTAPGAHHWRVQLLEFQANAGGAGDMITLGDGSAAQRSLTAVAHDLVIDRCYIHGDPTNGQKRAIALNSATTTISGSYIAEVKAVGQDSQAIAGWNGPGPFVITNNYLEAAGENILFGGADPTIPNLVPSGITITNNEVSKQATWRGQSWQVKNLLELKNARDVTVRGNTFEYNWLAAQTGFAILFTVRNQDGNCPWCQVEGVLFQDNIVRHSAGGISILGTDNIHPSLQTRSIVVRNNIFNDIDNQNWGGNGYFLQITGSPRDLVIDHNTVVQDHASGIMMVDSVVLGMVFTNNLARRNAYGIIGSDHAPGNDTISAFFPASTFAGNVIADGDASRYPSHNQFPSSDQFRAQFVSYASADYRLIPASSWRHAGTDGLDLGADVTDIGAPRDPSRPGGRPPRIPEVKRVPEVKR